MYECSFYDETLFSQPSVTDLVGGSGHTWNTLNQKENDPRLSQNAP
jgi:hypothetical protein